MLTLQIPHTGLFSYVNKTPIESSKHRSYVFGTEPLIAIIWGKAMCRGTAEEAGACCKVPKVCFVTGVSICSGRFPWRCVQACLILLFRYLQGVQGCYHTLSFR